jgi:hypothetical protein
VVPICVVVGRLAPNRGAAWVGCCAPKVDVEPPNIEVGCAVGCAAPNKVVPPKPRVRKTMKSIKFIQISRLPVVPVTDAADVGAPPNAVVLPNGRIVEAFCKPVPNVSG